LIVEILGKVSRYVARGGTILIAAALIAGMVGCGLSIPPCPTPGPSQNLDIRDWYDLNAVRDNLAGNHTLMNDLDSATAGYAELAGPSANGGKGWDPIGTFVPECRYGGFVGTFDGQGHEIYDLFINRPDEDLVGLFGCVYEDGMIFDIGVMNITVTGNWATGGLVGRNIRGIISNSYVVGSVNGNFSVGGLVGHNQGPVSSCYAAGSVVAGGAVGDVGAVMGGFGVGGLVGVSEEAVSGCYSTGNVTSYLTCDPSWQNLSGVGGLVGFTYGTVSNSYATGNVTGDYGVGGLVGNNWGTLSDSYSTGYVTGHHPHVVGGLIGESMVGKSGGGTANNCFWDVETSRLPSSAGGTFLLTADMKNIASFSSAAWNIIAVANPATRNSSYVWNIVDGQTYPFLSWQI
jgi:hypothetical protein